MGHGPNLKKAVGDSTTNVATLNAAIAKAQNALNNTMQKGIDYINANTEGIVTDKAGKETGVIYSNPNSYTKFTESYSLAKLDPIIDGAIDLAATYVSGGEDGANASQLVKDTGKIVKGILSLFASSSTVTEKVDQVFVQFKNGDDYYALYYASNSGYVAGQNAWGNKELIVITNVYIFAQVNQNTAITDAETRAYIYNDLQKVKEMLADYTVESITNTDLADTIKRTKMAIKQLEQQYKDSGGKE